MKRPAIATFVCLLAACGSTRDHADPASAGSGGPLRNMTLAMATAVDSDKNVLVEYYDPSCKFCSRMEQTTLADHDIRNALDDLVYVRLTRGEDAEAFEMRWKSAPTPSFVVLRADGRQLGSMVSGVIKPGAFADYLAWAKEGIGRPPAMPRGAS